MNGTKYSKTGFIFGIALSGLLTGCIGYVDEPHHSRGYGPPPPAYVETEVVVQPEYVYYPSYQVYYSSNTRQYIYLEGRTWVSRPRPPHISVDVLFASPSVRLDFHDHPSIHHTEVVRRYPKHWTPQGSHHGNQDNQDDRDDRRNGKQRN